MSVRSASDQAEMLQQANKGIKYLLITAMIIAAVVTVCSGGWKGLLLTASIGSFLMYLHLMLASIANAFIGHTKEESGVIFWKVLFIIIASAGFGIYFNI